MIDSELTVLSTTSPIVSHPSTKIWDATYSSIRRHLPNAHVILLADGVHPQEPQKAPEYEQYKRRIRASAGNMEFIESPNWQHQTGLLRMALGHVQTPLILWIDHDLPLLDRPIDWDGIERTLWNRDMGGIRFMMVGAEEPPSGEVELNRFGVPIYKTDQFLGWPTVGHFVFFQALMHFVGPQTKSYLGGVSETDPFPRLFRQNLPYGVYAPENAARCWHMDGHAESGPKAYIEVNGKIRYTEDSRR